MDDKYKYGKLAYSYVCPSNSTPKDGQGFLMILLILLASTVLTLRWSWVPQTGRTTSASADEGPEAPQEEDSTLALLVHSLGILNQVQLVVQMNSQVLVVLYSVLDVNRCKGCFPNATKPLSLASFSSLMQSKTVWLSVNFCRVWDLEF